MSPPPAGSRPEGTTGGGGGAEWVNALTHLLGALLALGGTVALILMAVQEGDPWKLVGVAVYGVTLVGLYSVSTLYHGARGRHKALLRRLDHHSIYLLIAGSYTPFCLVTLRGPWGWSLLAVVWALAVLGSLQELWSRAGGRVLSVVIYLVMGWVVLLALAPLLAALGPVGFGWLLAGGLFYTLGIVFYAVDSRYPYAHGVWHLFVLAGSAAHYVAILRFVV